MADAKIRLFVEHALGPEQPVPLSQEQAHYLFGVMRLAVGGTVLLFNGRNGEWRANVKEAGKRGGILICAAQTKSLVMPPDLWLLFAPIKKARTDFIVEKAVELGVARILPVQTQHTHADRIRQDRLQAHAMEAAEQCGATVVPQVAELAGLERVLDNWDGARRILWCDEALAKAASPLTGAERGHPWAILVGPEGGFSDREQARLRQMHSVVPISLGPRILRADTAAVAALTLWQSALGDWQ